MKKRLLQAAVFALCWAALLTWSLNRTESIWWGVGWGCLVVAIFVILDQVSKALDSISLALEEKTKLRKAEAGAAWLATVDQKVEEAVVESFEEAVVESDMTEEEAAALKEKWEADLLKSETKFEEIAKDIRIKGIKKRLNEVKEKRRITPPPADPPPSPAAADSSD